MSPSSVLFDKQTHYLSLQHNPPADVYLCERCSDELPSDEELSVVWTERTCRACLKKYKPEIGQLIEAGERARRTFHFIAEVQITGDRGAFARTLGLCQGRAISELVHLREVGL